MFSLRLPYCVIALSVCAACVADDKPPAKDAPAARPTVATVAAAAKPSIVTIHAEGRDRNRRGLGTGFVIGERDLIVTNLHVIGEGRAFRVEASDGRIVKIKAVHAWDRFHDLAVLQPDWEGKPLPALTLADDDSLAAGDPIVAVGNPLGLKHSVVSGVLSGHREVEGRRMLQLAIPVEPGNSGGPVMDMRQRVHGVITMKSLLSDNLGFAIRGASLRELLQRPSPVPLDKWQHLGGVDTDLWEPLGARWRQQAASLDVRGVSAGFGGRALCLHKPETPKAPFEVAVSVKLDDESGAAGLVFHADGEDRHYGFYPSNGNLRLTCFLGPTVYTWKILHNEPSPHYRPGKWNRLKVRIEAGQLTCYVNDQVVLVSKDKQLTAGRVGLAKFRTTVATFRNFEVGKQIASRRPTPEAKQRITKAMDSLGPLAAMVPDDLAALGESVEGSAELLESRAEELEKRAAELRKIRQDVRVREVTGQLSKLTQGDGAIDLSLAALWIARLDEAELDVKAHRAWIDTLAGRLRRSLPKAAGPEAKLKRLDEFLFVDNAFHGVQGNNGDYYHRANSHMHRVLEDREGLPITLAVLYMQLGSAIGLQLEGVGLPGHFVVRHRPKQGEPQLIDVFHGAVRLSREDAAKLVTERAGQQLRDEHLEAAKPRQILDRMLRNLLGVAQRREDKDGMLRYLEALVALDEQSVADRGMRAVLRFETGRQAAALADLDWILERAAEGIDLEQVRQMREVFSR